MKKQYSLLLFILFLCNQFLFSQDAVKKHPLLTDKFVFSGALFFPEKSVQFAVNNKEYESDLDISEKFGVDNYERTSDFYFGWRFAKKWKLNAGYFNVRDVFIANLEEDIQWEDKEFRAGYNVEAGVNVGVFRTFIGRLISSGNKHELGGGIGVHGMLISLYLEGEAFISNDDNILESNFEKLSKEAVAPLPNIGFWYYWTPSSKWAITTDADWFYLSVGEYTGWLWDAAAGVKFQAVDFFGVGLNYKYYSIDLVIDKEKWDGKAKLRYNGPLVMVYFNF